jgi:glutamine synthetase
MTPKEVLALCREKDVKAVDLRFTDFPGRFLHLTIPVDRLTEEVFEDGLGFDGSAVRGWQVVNESDMLIVPQPDTAFFDPFPETPTMVLIGNILDPLTREDYSRDPRNVARKAVNYLLSTSIADTAHFGPEAEFFVFDSVSFDQSAHEAHFCVDSREAVWNRGNGAAGFGGATPGNSGPSGGNRGYKIRHKDGYLPVPPHDHLMDLRNEMMRALTEAGLKVEAHHHEAATAGQCEIDIEYRDLVRMADQMMIYKHVVRNVAWRAGMTATFMPKPLFGDAGSGMHVHFSLWKDGQPLFAGPGYAGLSDLAMYAVGGILQHAAAILAFSNPTTNSYKRLVPGFEAPINLAYSQRNRSAALRIPVVSQNPAAKRIEFRCPDPTCNPYLTFAAILMAAIDGIRNKRHPGEPLDKNIYDLPAETLAKVPTTPKSLDQALSALEADHDFLLRGDVFTEDVIRMWIDSKRKHEVREVDMRPHPYEFCLYYDA